MLKLFYDFFPIVLFFIAFKIYGIYVATGVGIAVTGLQLLFNTLWHRRFDKQLLITFIVFVFFGGMTLYFHNPLFVKWKPTVIYWIFAVILLGSQFIGEKPIIQRMLTKMLENATVPDVIWRRLNMAWVIFFTALGCLNLYVAYSFSTDTWVNFKLYGTLGALMGFSFLQAMCLARYMSESK